MLHAKEITLEIVAILDGTMVFTNAFAEMLFEWVSCVVYMLSANDGEKKRITQKILPFIRK